MPPEYCEYGPDFETHCLKWLQKNHLELFTALHSNSGSASKSKNTAQADGDANAPPPPTEPWTTRQRLEAFYTKYQPDKLDGIDAILEKYEGKEEKLFLALVKKYGEEPEDPYITARYGGDSNEDGDDADETPPDLSTLSIKKRRGAPAKATTTTQTRIILQKISRNRKKAVTHIVGMDTVPHVHLKDVAKMFSKRFAGSSSVKDKEIIVQGDHGEEAARMIVEKFGVKKEDVFFDLDGEFVPYSEF